MKGLLAVAVVSLMLAGEGLAQTRPDPAPPAKPPEAKPAETHIYSSEGRRDPFVSLVAVAAEPRTSSRRVEGLEGFATSEIAVRGILRSQNAIVAMIQAPDKRTYIVRAGDRLADGLIKEVTPQGLVVVQEIADPASPSRSRQREVRRLLPSIETATP
jgi:Tfp pilus assembly protein PilP